MITVKKNNSVCIIEVPYTSIDLDALEKIKAEAEKLFSQSYFKIIMNLSKISYLSSTGLGLLVYLNNKCNDNNGKFGVFGLQDYTLEMVKLTKLDSVIKIFDNEEETMKNLFE